MSEFAADDDRTQRHEQAKDRAFTTAIVVGLLLLVVGVLVMTVGGLWILLGAFLFLLGGSFTFASLLGFFYRRKARRTLAAHPWRRVAVEVLVTPPGRTGRCLIGVDGHANQLTATGIDRDSLQKIRRAGQLEYAGDLDDGGMLFVRIPDAEEIYIATVRKATKE